jgi:hypothetical protein
MVINFLFVGFIQKCWFKNFFFFFVKYFNKNINKKKFFKIILELFLILKKLISSKCVKLVGLKLVKNERVIFIFNFYI